MGISGYSSGAFASERGGDVDANESQVTGSTEMAVLSELIASLRTLVFAGEMVEQESRDEESGIFAVSMSDSEGRSLVISPLAGTVQVTAEWRRVRQVKLLLE